MGPPRAPPEWCRGAAAVARQSAQAETFEVHFACGCELASRSLAKPIQMSFSGLEIPPQSPPARAPHCALVGGYMRKERATQPGRGHSWQFNRWLWSEASGASCAGSGLLAVFEVHFVCGCELASRFLAKPHTNEFFGIGNSTPEPAGPCAPLRPGRWVCEKRESQLCCGGAVGALRRLGTSPRQPSQAAVGPVSYIAALAWCPTVCRGTDDCGEHHPSTAAARASRKGPARHLGRLCRRKGIPHVRRGVGDVGAWRLARPFQSHRGYLPVGDALGLNLPVGPPLGALRR
jgi:hypothetical protein